MRLQLRPRNNRLNVAVRLACCDVHIVLELRLRVMGSADNRRNEAGRSRAIEGAPHSEELMAVDAGHCQEVVLSRCSQGSSTRGAGPHLACHHRTRQEVQVREVEEDRLHLGNPAHGVRSACAPASEMVVGTAKVAIQSQDML